MNKTTIIKATAHEEYWQLHVFGWGVYQYDPTDDGPEIKIIQFFEAFPYGATMGANPYVGFIR